MWSRGGGSEAGWDYVPARALCGAAELALAETLDCGQTFRWRRDDGGAWVGVIGRAVARVWTGDGRVWCRTIGELDLERYFRFDFDLSSLSAELVAGFPGLRVLAQPAEETLLTFVCSPASNIIRITRSVDLLARLYGEPIAMGQFAFPPAEVLAELDPAELARRTGLGFRGRYLAAVARALRERGEGWVEGLASLPYDVARVELQTLPYVGPKIADCACLFGLGFDEAVPVDTHVWGIARELFPDEVPTRTLTPGTYRAVLDAFRRRYGESAGWAQQYLFHARRVGRALPMPSTVSLVGA
jgi:N-glycosylase/DNA lyase